MFGFGGLSDYMIQIEEYMIQEGRVEGGVGIEWEAKTSKTFVSIRYTYDS